MRRALMASVLFWAAATGSSWAEGPGPASALGSDRLMLNGTIFQFNGLAGVEFHQFCFVDGQAWACGAPAIRALQNLLDGIMVTCSPTGEKNGDVVFAVCKSGNEDIGEIMVQRGWAVANPAQSDTYVAAEQVARENGDGIWRGLVLEPWVYRDDIAAIEENYSERAGDSILAEAEQALAADPRIDFFADVRLRTLDPAEDAAWSDHEVRVTGLAAGFVPGAIEARGVFSWPLVSRVLEDWRRSAVGSVISGAEGPVWDGLLNRPNEIDAVDDEAAYYSAMRQYAAPLKEQGRQPLLLVAGPTLPSWVGQWFNGSPPQGAEVTEKTDIAARGYLGTIDGVDVYVGPTPETDSLLFPDDLLVDAGYRKSADGAILAMSRNTLGASDELAFRYSMAIEWKPDVVVWLRYPSKAGDES